MKMENAAGISEHKIDRDKSEQTGRAKYNVSRM